MAEEAKKDADGDFEASAFEALERDFQEILQELVGDKSLEHFRQEYEKLHRALKKSHESEKHLIKKCRELNTEIVQNAVKVQTALKLSQEDQATITALKKEIERAWKMVETSHEKEQRAKETIQNLKSEISKLGRLVEQGAGLSINQENMVNQLVQEKNDLVKHRDMLSGQVGQLQTQNSDLGLKVQKLEAERQASSSNLLQLQEELQKLLDDNEQQLKKKDKVEKEMKEVRNTIELTQNEINAKKEVLNRNEEALAQLESQVKDEKANIDTLNVRHDALERQTTMVKKNGRDLEEHHRKTLQENMELKTRLQGRQQDLDALKASRHKVDKAFEALQRKKEIGDRETQKVVASKEALKADIDALRTDLGAMKRQADFDSKHIMDLMHEKDILSKNLMRADEQSKVQVELVTRHKNQAENLGKDLQRWKSDLQVKQHRTHELDRQREKYAAELSTAKARCEDAAEELKARDSQMALLKKAILDVKVKLGQQKNLYETVRSDKNLYSKNYLESLDEISEMRKKFKVMNHQIEQLKEEIKEKDKALVSEHTEHQSISRDTEKFTDNLKKHQKATTRSHQVVEQQQGEIKKLESTIQEAESERQNQRKEFEAVISERNILGTQLVRRNEELALLYEKIKIQESTLKKGEIQYRLRQDDIKKQKDAIARLKQDLYISQQEAESADDLKKEVYHLQRELLQERTKVKALSEELENPMNVHRWRKLEGSDPAMYELIQKVRTLQKRLIGKTEEVVAKDVEIQEKERLHRELTQILEKQPGPEVMEQLEVYQENYASKVKQMKAMHSELRTYQTQVGDYKDEIERITRELQEVKNKYFVQKKKEQVQQDQQRGDSRAVHPRPVPQARFVGGGFNLAH